MATQTPNQAVQKLPNGRAAAALLAAGIGAGFLGVIVLLSEISAAVGAALNWINPVGPLSGKVITTIVVFFASWIGLHFAWKNKDVNFSRTVAISFVLLAVGLIGTFPPFWHIFG
ncbi:hypothetical protein TFLX_06619 [Thermoflexales bacterium]|nr:hypothetical protein TFLX_06619 [Thermoflexales bacterium]